jgi:hypothetical protein
MVKKRRPPPSSQTLGSVRVDSQVNKGHPNGVSKAAFSASWRGGASASQVCLRELPRVATLPTLLLHLNIPCVESYLVSSTIETNGVPASLLMSDARCPALTLIFSTQFAGKKSLLLN